MPYTPFVYSLKSKSLAFLLSSAFGGTVDCIEIVTNTHVYIDKKQSKYAQKYVTLIFIFFIHFQVVISTI